MQNMQGRGSAPAKICPYLGIREDKETSFSFPSMWNRCHLSKSVSAIKLDYQRTYCLTENYAECQVYTGGEKVRLPSEIRMRLPLVRPNAFLIIILFLIVILGVGAGWAKFTGNSLPILPAIWSSVQTAVPLPGNISDATPTKNDSLPIVLVSKTPTPSSTPKASQTIKSSFSPTATVNATITAPETAYCGYELDKVINSDSQQFIIHRVSEGENMELFETKYNTTTEAIQAANYFLPVPLWVDLVIVIPVGNNDTANMPAFEPHFIADVSLNVETLAQSLNTTPSELDKYNNWNNMCQAFSGWILIPREKANP